VEFNTLLPMENVNYNLTLSAREKLARVKKAKGGKWYEGWAPYCLNCSCTDKMSERSYGFQCLACKNMIGWNLTRLEESPLNQANQLHLRRQHR
jgi:hypothetical protein